MEADCRNIYKTARSVAGMTQERWAEALGCSVETIRNYETGCTTPSDEIVRAMTEISGLTPLGYWHLCRKSSLANDELPEVERLPLPQAVLQLLTAIGDFTDLNADLVRAAADGRISAEEEKTWKAIQLRLEKVVQAALQVKYADGGDQ